MQRYNTYNFDKHLYVVGDAQSLHVSQLFKITSLVWSETPFSDFTPSPSTEHVLEHVSFGKVNGMSTRKGEVKFLDEILDMAKDAMMVQMRSKEERLSEVEDPERTADEIGMTCVKVQDMMAKRYV